MLFRHFGSKAALFEEAAVEPVVAFMDDYVAEWQGRDHGATDPVAEVRDFLSRLTAVMAADRQLLLAILAAGQFDDALEAAADRLRQAFARVIDLFEGMIETEFSLRGLETPDRTAFARLLLGVVISLSLHGEWLEVDTGSRQGVSLERMLDEAARVTVFGVNAGPRAARAPELNA